MPSAFSRIYCSRARCWAALKNTTFKHQPPKQCVRDAFAVVHPPHLETGLSLSAAGPRPSRPWVLSVPQKKPSGHPASPFRLPLAAPNVNQVCLLSENNRTSHYFAVEILRPPPVLGPQSLWERSYHLLHSWKHQPGDGSRARHQAASTGMHAWHCSGGVLCLSDGGGCLQGVKGDAGGGLVENHGQEVSERTY